MKIDLNKTPLTWTQLEAENIKSLAGGRYFPPPICQPGPKVAILIPYRNRDQNLRILLHHLHPMLRRQQLTYGIFVIEQVNQNKS